eukprot:scpid53071/ scgid32473/ 
MMTYMQVKTKHSEGPELATLSFLVHAAYTVIPRGAGMRSLQLFLSGCCFVRCNADFEVPTEMQSLPRIVLVPLRVERNCAGVYVCVSHAQVEVPNQYHLKMQH